MMVDEGPLHQLRVLARSTPRDRGLQKGPHQGIWVLKKVHTKGYGSSNTALVIWVVESLVVKNLFPKGTLGCPINNHLYLVTCHFTVFHKTD